VSPLLAAAGLAAGAREQRLIGDRGAGLLEIRARPGSCIITLSATFWIGLRLCLQSAELPLSDVGGAVLQAGLARRL